MTSSLVVPDPARGRSVTVTAVSYRSLWGNRAANLAKMMQVVSFVAAHHGSRIIVFPQLALTGYECKDENTRNGRACSMHRRNAEPIPGPSTQSLAGLAASLGVYVVFGMPELEVSTGNVYDSVAVVGPEGILGSYRGLYPSPIGKSGVVEGCFKAGDGLPVFATRYGTVGVQVGLDLYYFPELTRLLALKGAGIIFNCVALPAGQGLLQDVVLGAPLCRSLESLVYVVSASMVGGHSRHFCGRSSICGPDPRGVVGVLAGGDELEGIVTATLDLETVSNLQCSAQRRRSLLGVVVDETMALAKSGSKILKIKSKKSSPKGS